MTIKFVRNVWVSFDFKLPIPPMLNINTLIKKQFSKKHTTNLETYRTAKNLHMASLSHNYYVDVSITVGRLCNIITTIQTT